MRIDVLCYNLSNNALGRAYLLADLLRRQGHRTRIVGLQLGDSVWGPLKDCDIETVAVRSGARYPDVLGNLGKLLARLDCDVALASKPRVSSFGAALLKRMRPGSGLKILLDIDDWEAGLERPSSGAGFLRRLPETINVDSFYDPLAMGKLTRMADGITVSTTFLQKLYGGRLLPHVRDTDFLDPSKYDRQAMRAALGLDGEFVIAFLGSIRRHKGVELLLSILPRLEPMNARLLLVGTDNVDPALREIMNRRKKYILEHPEFPYRDLPKFHMVADLVVLPQMDTPFGRAQLPMKLLDAMAMARPIISTNVSDIPAILEGCGVVLESYSEDELVQRIVELHGDERLRRRLGEAARKRCVERYSYRQGMETLEAALKAL
jgi:glycosyltransferase involved in cell wall biosynthesis